MRERASRRQTNDKAVVVTGGGAGLGRALCFEFADRRFHVVCVDRNSEALDMTTKELQLEGHRVLPLLADVASLADCERIVASTLDWSGRVDMLVNNAGISARKRAADTSMAELDDLLAVNFFAPVQLTNGFLPYMTRQGSGTIISIGSVAGGVPNPLEAAYCASKAALSRWSHSLSVELHGSGVRAMIVHPGPMSTSIWSTDELKSPYSGRLWPPEYVARKIVSMSIRPVVQMSIPRRFGVVTGGYPLLGPQIRWGLRRFARNDLATPCLSPDQVAMDTSGWSPVEPDLELGRPEVT